MVHLTSALTTVPKVRKGEGLAALSRPQMYGGFHAGNDPDSSAALDLDCWAPRVNSADLDIIKSKDLLEGRILDLLENDGFASGALEHHVNHTVGLGLRLNYTPIYDSIGLSADNGIVFKKWVEQEFKIYTKSRQNHVDANRKFSFDALQTQAYRSFMAHGEILASIEYKPSRGKYRTCIRLIDPARLSTPADHTQRLGRDIRGGVEVDKDGAPVAYWIADRHPRPFSQGLRRGTEKVKWTRYTPYSARGRQRIIHIFDPIRPEQTRGYTMFAPIIRSMKMIDRLADAQLQAALMQTLFAVVIKSELDWEDAMNVLGAEDGSKSNSLLLDYMTQRGEYYSRHKVNVNGAKAVHLLPNEDLELKDAGTIKPEVKEFFDAMRQEAARGSNMSTEQFTGDFSRASYSSSRMSNIESNRGHQGRRTRVMAPFNHAIFTAWLEEAMALNPDRSPSVPFRQSQDALTMCEWIGPPMVDADPRKTAEADDIKLENGSLSLVEICANDGRDWRDVLDNQKQVLEYSNEIQLTQLQADRAQLMEPKKEEPAGSSSDGGDDADS